MTLSDMGIIFFDTRFETDMPLNDCWARVSCFVL